MLLPTNTPTNYFCCQQERFNLSGVIYVMSSACASLGGTSTKDPLRNCCWEKEQSAENMHLSEHQSQASEARSEVTSRADLHHCSFQDKKPHLYLQILSRCLSSYLGRTTPLSLWAWRPSSCRFSGTLQEENKQKILSLNHTVEILVAYIFTNKHSKSLNMFSISWSSYQRRTQTRPRRQRL